jgi:hypothetical protein
MRWLDDEQLEVSATVKTLTRAKIDGDAGGARRTRAFIENGPTASSSIRYRLTGSDPNANLGHVLVPGASVTIEGYENLVNLKMIRVGGVDGIVHVTYGN